MRIAVAGAGAFGAALAVALSSDRSKVTLCGRDAAAMDRARATRTLPRLPGVTLPDAIELAWGAGPLERADIVLLAVPMQTLSAILAEFGAALSGKPLVACCKGVDLATLTGPTGVIATQVPQAVPAILTGPSFAADIARGLPTALSLACRDADTGSLLQQALSTAALRIYRTTDTTGAELGGALKNVIAIAAGACIGAGYGDSARAALMTRGFAEMQRTAAVLGGLPETLSGLSGLGDLALTCTSDQSRNYRYGHALGAGTPWDDAITVEGAATACAMARLARDLGLDVPVTEVVAALVSGDMSVPDALQRLLSRPLREE